jgi:AcrR family transcriptional regulator
VAKSKRDAYATKQRIIEEARSLFSKRGYDATTVDDIAAASEINKALIYYYFKNKAQLYATIMSGLFDAIYDEVIVASKRCSSVEEELSVFIRTYAEYAYTNPYFPALLLRELSDSGAHLPEMMFVSMRRLFLLLSNILKRGEEGGVFLHSIAMVVHFMIVGSLNLMVTTQSLREKAEEMDSAVDTCSKCSMEEVAAYIYETIKKSLEVKLG